MKHPIVLLLCATVMAQDIIIERPPTPQPLSPIQLESCDFDVKIDGSWAQTQVKLTFFNPNARRLDGTFLYPLPSGSQVEGVQLSINGEMTPAELLDADKARSIYEDIVRRLLDPALVQYAGADLIKARIFPFEPRSRRTLALSFRSLLTADGGLTSYRIPLRNGGSPSVSLEGFLTTPGDLRINAVTTHQVKTLEKTDRSWRFEGRGLACRDIEISYAYGGEGTELYAQFHSPNPGEGWVMLRIAPPAQIGAKSKLPKDVVMVLDTSGSMAGEKLTQAKRALDFCLSSLGPRDRFQIIRFSTESEPFESGWVTADAANIKRAKSFVQGFQAIGGTNIEDALADALQLGTDAKRPQMVLFVTDGKPTIGERDDLRLTNGLELGSRRIFTLGVGDEVNTHLLDRLSVASRGARSYVRPGEDLELKLSGLYMKIQSPVMTDLKIKTDGIRLSQMTPDKLPDLFHGSELQVLARFTGQGSARLTLEGMVEGKSVAVERAFDLPHATTDAARIAKVWAQRRIGFLLDQIRLNGEHQELKDEVLKLAKTWGIVTPYTSFLVLEDEVPSGDAPPVRPATEIRRRQADRTDALARKSGASSVVASESVRALSESDVAEEERPDVYAAHPTQWKSGRMFENVGGLWIERSGKPIDLDRARTVAFASEAYFKLAADHPDLRDALAQGKVALWIDGHAVIITDAS